MSLWAVWLQELLVPLNTALWGEDQVLQNVFTLSSSLENAAPTRLSTKIMVLTLPLNAKDVREFKRNFPQFIFSSYEISNVGIK